MKITLAKMILPSIVVPLDIPLSKLRNLFKVRVDECQDSPELRVIHIRTLQIVVEELSRTMIIGKII